MTQYRTGPPNEPRPAPRPRTAPRSLARDIASMSLMTIGGAGLMVILAIVHPLASAAYLCLIVIALGVAFGLYDDGDES